MNRNTAKKYLGEHVILDEGSQGQYICQLEDMKVVPNKPWRAVLRIVGVLSYPEINLETLTLNEPVYKKGEIHECSGQKIKGFDESFQLTYDQSVSAALKEEWDRFQQANQDTEVVLSQIQQELRKLKSENLIFEDNYVYYQLVNKGRQIQLYDEAKREALSLEGSPFEFEIEVNGEWVEGSYVSNLTFQMKNGRYVELSHGSTVRLNKTQFDPYQILLNELEEPSLIALEKGLKELGIGHEHSIYCHNSLLIKLISSFNQSSFSGVNFISYATSKNQYIVQHHYERTLRDDDEDITYDRFEFTADTGERILTTYATQFSND